MATQTLAARRRRNQLREQAGAVVSTSAVQLRQWMYLDLQRQAKARQHLGNCARCAAAIGSSSTVPPCRDGRELVRLAAESERAVAELRERIATAAAAARDAEPGTDLATLF